MKRKLIVLGFCLLLISTLMPASAGADEVDLKVQGLLASKSQGLTTPAYLWWYGCSPTSAGMMMGYYDRSGYDGKTYTNLVAGGVADLTAGQKEKDTIASAAHITAFYRNGYGGSGDDIARVGSFDSLADFMGTNQDAYGNSNGSTTFYYWTNGEKFTAADALGYGVQDFDGMYGITEYVQYAGYNVNLAAAYTQLSSNQSALGFTFAEYMAEIDAGRVVMIQVAGHSMFGYGYAVGAAPTVLLHDTWDELDHSMVWGDSYSGMEMWGVTCFELSGGDDDDDDNPVPEPMTVILLLSGLIGLGVFKRSRI